MGRITKITGKTHRVCTRSSKTNTFFTFTTVYRDRSTKSKKKVYTESCATSEVLSFIPVFFTVSEFLEALDSVEILIPTDEELLAYSL